MNKQKKLLVGVLVAVAVGLAAGLWTKMQQVLRDDDLVSQLLLEWHQKELDEWTVTLHKQLAEMWWLGRLMPSPPRDPLKRCQSPGDGPWWSRLSKTRKYLKCLQEEMDAAEEDHKVFVQNLRRNVGFFMACTEVMLLYGIYIKIRPIMKDSKKQKIAEGSLVTPEADSKEIRNKQKKCRKKKKKKVSKKVQSQEKNECKKVCKKRDKKQDKRPPKVGKSWKETMIQVLLRVTADRRRYVIGPKGANLRKLKKEFPSVNVSVPFAQDATKNFIRLVGLKSEVNAASKVIIANLEAVEAKLRKEVDRRKKSQTTLTLDVAPDMRRHVVGPGGQLLNWLAQECPRVRVRVPPSCNVNSRKVTIKGPPAQVAVVESCIKVRLDKAQRDKELRKQQWKLYRQVMADRRRDKRKANSTVARGS